ncbi:MAG TPA: glycosyltransferase [Saprospiraceae bacterium]|nr:glycosyltransferase [Saprospiraceae bacterium]
MILFSTLAVTVTIGYLLLLWYYQTHWKPVDSPPATQAVAPLPFCSVVIAARNEETAIAQCLQSVTTQSYPRNLYEVLVVNDGSEDNTVEKIQQFPSVQVLHTTESTRGKKHALVIGISAARGEIIVTTDADCVVLPGWLHALVSTFDNDTQMITGPVFIDEAQNAFERFQALEIAGFAMITAAGIQSGLHHLANGANMAFRKTAFGAVGGFSGNAGFASGDDVFLVQNIAHVYSRSIKFVWNTDALVQTTPCHSLRTLIQQRLRWATKNKALRENSVYWIWTFIWITFAVNFLTLILAFSSLQAITLSVLLIMMIAIAEYAFLRRVVRYYKKQNQLKGFVLSFMMHGLYVLYIGMAAVWRQQYTWKGRKLR